MAHTRCAEDEQSESEGRFGKAEPRRGAQASAFALVREVFAEEPRPRKRRTNVATRKSTAVNKRGMTRRCAKMTRRDAELTRKCARMTREGARYTRNAAEMTRGGAKQKSPPLVS